MRVTVVGASGFLGSHISNALEAHPTHQPRYVSRNPTKCSSRSKFRVADLTKSDGWAEILEGQDAVILAAGHPSIPSDCSVDILNSFFGVNVDGVIKLAQRADLAGVKRFIFISSVKVNGEFTSLESAFRADDQPNPSDFYAISKAKAEEGLKKIGSDTGMDIVIIRPPLVYGFGVQGNLLLIKKYIERGIPLPFASVRNQRSLVSVDNLVDLIIKCIDNSQAKNRVFLVSDGHDLSTPELVECIAKAIGRSSRLFPLPPRALAFSLKLAGQNRLAERLLGSLRVDISETQRVLKWKPRFSVEDGIRCCFKSR